MVLSRTQIISLITVAAVAITTVSILVVVDPFTPRYTLTLIHPASSDCGGSNVTLTPGGDVSQNVTCTSDPTILTFKAGTEITLYMNYIWAMGLRVCTWQGPDASQIQTIVSGHLYKIVMTKDMNITVNWCCV